MMKIDTKDVCCVIITSNRGEYSWVSPLMMHMYVRDEDTISLIYVAMTCYRWPITERDEAMINGCLPCVQSESFLFSSFFFFG